MNKIQNVKEGRRAVFGFNVTGVKVAFKKYYAIFTCVRVCVCLFALFISFCLLINLLDRLFIHLLVNWLLVCCFIRYRNLENFNYV